MWKDCFSDTAFITNQESNKLDVIDLKNKKKSEFSVGEKPAGIFVDKKNNEIFVSNPGSHNISRINLKNNSQQLLVSGKSPMSIQLCNKKEYYMLAIGLKILSQ